MSEARLKEIETYITRRKNTAAQYIATTLIMYMYLTAGRRPGARVSKHCWEQENLDLEGLWEAVRVAEA